MLQSLLIFGSGELIKVFFFFYGFKLWTHIVVIDFELEDFFITNGIGNHIRVQFTPKNAGGCFWAQRIFWENRCSCKAKLIKLFEFTLQVFLGFTKLRAMTFIEDKNHLLIINWQFIFAFHQVIKFLDGGNHDFIIIACQVFFQFGGAGRAVYAIGAKASIFFHGLIVQIFSINHEKYLVNKRQCSSKSCRFKTGQCLAWACGVPDIAPTFVVAPVFGLKRAVNFP